MSNFQSDMVAPWSRSEGAPPSDTPTLTTSSDSSHTSQLEHDLPAHPRSSTLTQHPDQHWDGRRETLGSWFAELETSLSTVSPELYEFAVEFLLSDRSKTVLFAPGQAAQLDGVLPRPDYTWENPAPTSSDAYDVPQHVTVAAYEQLYRDRCLRDPALDPTAPPIVPNNTPYPIDGSKYVLSLAQLHSWQMKLRNAILRFIADLPVRHILAKQFPRDGRALLDHLRAQANTPLTSSQVNSILADIQTLISHGIKEDTVASFREIGVIYHRLLSRIPDDNPSRDSPAMQAMRYVQAVIKNRTHVGQSLMHHFASHGVDQNDPNAVRESIAAFLEDQASIRRLCAPHAQRDAPPPPPLPPTLPDLNELKTLLAQSLLNHRKDPPKNHRPWEIDKNYHAGTNDPCHHCGGDHWNVDCPNIERDGYRSFLKEAMSREKSRRKSMENANALVTAAFAKFHQSSDNPSAIPGEPSDDPITMY